MEGKTAMTDQDLAFLKSQIDEIVLIEPVEGEPHPAQVLFVFDEGETPDAFYLKVERGPDGTWVQQGAAGHSVLLSEIAAVRPLPPVEPSAG
jgi:hypothetical protein